MLDIGTLAERKFSAWCTEVGITCNKSIEDKEAWDFILEFDDPRTNSSSTLDESLPGLKCFIQIKSSADSKSNKQISLRNWEKMVNNNHPVFIVRIEFNEDSKPEKTYLIHIGEELIEKTLRKLRKIKSEETYQLGIKKQSYPVKKEFQLDGCDGKALKAGLSEYLCKGIDKYVNWKSTFKKTVGYEEEELIIEYKPKDLNNPHQELVDLTLGIQSELEITGAKKRRKRFGEFSEYVELGPGKIKVDVESEFKADLDLISEDGKDSYLLKLDFYSPKGLKGLSQESLKLLAKDDFIAFEADYSIGRLRIDFRLPEFDKNIELEGLKNVATFLYAQLMARERKTKLNAFFTVNQVKWIEFEVDIDLPKGDDFKNVIKAIYDALVVKKYFGIDKIETNLNELMEQRKRFGLISRLDQGLSTSLRIEFWVNDEFTKGEVGFSFPFNTFLGRYELFQGLSVIGKPEKLSEDNERKYYRVTSEKFFRLNKLILTSRVSSSDREQRIRRTEKIGNEILKEHGIDEIFYIEN